MANTPAGGTATGAAPTAAQKPDPTTGQPTGQPTGQLPGHASDPVLVVDYPASRTHRYSDLLSALIMLLGIGVILLLSVYARETATGVVEDIQTAATKTVRQIFQVPINFLQGVVIFAIPAVLGLAIIRDRRWRALVTTTVAGLIAGLAVEFISLAFERFAGDTPLAHALTVTFQGQVVVGLAPSLAVMGAILVAAGPRSSSRGIRVSWIVLWFVVILAILQGAQTLPGATTTVVLGTTIGSLARWLIGVVPIRETPAELTRAVRRAGVDAAHIIRIDVHDQPLGAWHTTVDSPIGFEDAPPEILFALAHASHSSDDDAATPDTSTPATTDDEAAHIDHIEPAEGIDVQSLQDKARKLRPRGAESSSDVRHYLVRDRAGNIFDIRVIDADQQILGFLAAAWTRLRIKGLGVVPRATLRDAGNHEVLMAMAVKQAGVEVPELIGISWVKEGLLVAHEHVGKLTTLDSLSREDITEEMTASIWEQLQQAHRHGLCHREIHGGNILVSDSGQVYIVGWGASGEIASSLNSRRMDLAQTLALLAVVMGAEKAVESTHRVLQPAQLTALTPLLQGVILPSRTRNSVKSKKSLLGALREKIISRIPTADVPPAQIRRFSPRTVITVTVAMVALYVLLTSMNWAETGHALRQASLMWVAIGFAVSLIGYVGNAICLMAYSPERLSLWQSTLVQVAASVITLVAPAGIGPAALNLRFLNRKKVPTALAAATVTLVQISQLVTTVILLLILGLATGSAGSIALPSAGLIWAVLGVVIILGLLMAIPVVRTWVWKKVGPTLQQVWPRLVWLFSNPLRLAFGVLGSLVLTVSFVATFACSLAAFGYHLPIMTLAVTYLLSNTVGSVVPSPGGIGPVEAALTGGLVLAGIPSTAALSAAILYRLLTFWGRVPLGWISLRYLQNKEVL